jgi:ribosomal protein S18 acetylase RimI-like enzyme
MDYSLRPATDAEREWLDQLRRDAYRELFYATWGHWDEARHQRHFAESWTAGQISMIEVERQDVGMVQLHESPRSVEIEEIQIRPEHQEHGLGTRVLNDIIESAAKRKKLVTLSLGLKNLRAYQLYCRLGFRETGRSDTHIFMEYR